MTIAPSSTASAKTEHFLFLDGLRGVAALLVMLMHWLSGHGLKPFGGSLLAVDYFFMLSGFVVTHAYQRRLRVSPGFGGFIMKRIIRLHPIIVLGFALGLARFAMLAVIEGDGLQDLTLLGEFARSVLLIPRPGADMAMFFSMNNAMWSLHFEFLAYIAFGLVLYRLRSRWLWVLLLATMPGVLLWAEAVYGDARPIVAMDSATIAYLSGLARVFFAFAAGMLVYRTMPRWSRLRLPTGRWLVILLVAPLALSKLQMPVALAGALLLVGFPYILAAGSQVTERPVLSRLDTMLGNLSYPLYALHIPIIWTLSGAFRALGIGFVEQPALNGLIILPITIVASYAAFVIYDRPLRKALNGWLATRRAGSAPHLAAAK